MPTNTTTYSFQKPVVGADEDDWGGYLNSNWDKVDDLFDGTTAITGIDINSGTIDGTVIGGSSAAAGTFTTLTASTSITGTLATAAQPNVTSLGTLTGLTIGGNLSVDGGTIKLDGNYPVGTANVALGDGSMAAVQAGADSNTVVGHSALSYLTTGDQNTAVGRGSLNSVTTGSYNSAFGFGSLNQNTGEYNTAVGTGSLQLNTTASNNTAVGYQALYANTTGSENLAFGYQALDANTSGTNNIGIGYAAVGANTTGIQNIGIGSNSGALASNTTGNYNVALGNDALKSNTTASNNTAVGYQAGYSNTTGDAHVYVGRLAGYAGTTSRFNTFIGDEAGYSVTTGVSNVFIGNDSGYSVTTGSKNTIIGSYSGNQGGLDIRTSSNNIVLSDGDGNPKAYWDASGTLNQVTNYNSYRIAVFENTNNTSGNGTINSKLLSNCNNTASYHFVANTAGGGDMMYIHGNGNLVNYNNSYGSISDVKLKENIVDSGSQWDDIKAITVRKYSMKAESLDAPNKLGVIAQELEAAGMSGLVSETQDRDDDGNVLGTVTKTVNYSILYMKAVKALQEAMDRIETLEAKVTALENA